MALCGFRSAHVISVLVGRRQIGSTILTKQLEPPNAPLTPQKPIRGLRADVRGATQRSALTDNLRRALEQRRVKQEQEDQE